MLSSPAQNAHRNARTGVKVYLQDERLKIKTFEDYCGLYLKAAGRDSESGEAPKHVHLRANDRWEIVVAVSEGQFQQVRRRTGRCVLRLRVLGGRMFARVCWGRMRGRVVVVMSARMSGS